MSAETVDNSVARDAALFRHALRKGLITLRTSSTEPHDHMRCSWMEGSSKSCDISNSAYDGVVQQKEQATPIGSHAKQLADALASCILASGIVRKDVDGLTGPQLLLFAEDLRKMLESKAAQPPVQGWQPIESAPEDTEVLIGAYIDGVFRFGRSVMFYEQASEFEGETFSGWVWAVDNCDDSVAENPTHWMPVPTPPEAPNPLGPVMHTPSGVTFDSVIAATSQEDLMPLTPSSQQDTQAVLQGWRVERVSDDDVRVYGPDAETWLLRANPGKGTFEDFVHRFCFALASCPQPEAAPAVAQGESLGAKALRLADAIDPFTRKAPLDHLTSTVAAQPQGDDTGRKVYRKVYKNSKEHDQYLSARFSDRASRSFVYDGHRWAYVHTHFDDQGDYDLIYRVVEG